MAETTYALPDALRLLHNPACTRMAGLLNSAARLRRPATTQPVERLEVNSRGYTLAQCRAGGFQAGLKANRMALTANAPAVLKVLLEAEYLPVALQLVGILQCYGVDVAPLQRQVQAHQRRQALAPQLAAAQAALEAAVAARGARWEELDAKLPAVPVHLLAAHDLRIERAQRVLDDLHAQVDA